MLITPVPGANLENILRDLRNIQFAAGNAQSPGVSTAYGRLLHYLGWAKDSVRLLRGQIRDADIDRLVLTRTHDQLFAGVGHLAGSAQENLVNGLVSRELAEREAAFEAAYNALQAQIIRWSGNARFVIADTSFFVQHPTRFDEVDYPNLLGSVPDDGVHLVIPIVIVDELDALKESRKPRARYRAGYSLAVLDRILAANGRGTLRPADTSLLNTTGALIEATTVEILFDPAGHARLPLPDDEIVDRTLAVQNLAGRPAHLVTYDTGQASRARFAGLKTTKLRDDAGTGEEPDWAAEEAKQGNGGRAHRREKQRLETRQTPTEE